ncbi:MAG: helix-turn-helix transcriptional regulator [Phycisphaerae bacterium]
MTENTQLFVEPGVGRSIKLNRIRAGLTQVQLARAISRSGKFLSEVENGKARITQRDLERLADAIGISSDKMSERLSFDGGDLTEQLPRRVRDVSPAGMTIMSFTQLVSHLDRAGWLRNANVWMIGAGTFPEEHDLALVEQIASLVATKEIGLRYVFGADRLEDVERAQLSQLQGTFDVLPSSLRRALRWSAAMRAHISSSSDRLVGYAATWSFPAICRGHTLLWVETEDVSWSDVMPLLYCRSLTRTFENPNETVAFWHHLPREIGSRILLELAQKLKTVQKDNGDS